MINKATLNAIPKQVWTDILNVQRTRAGCQKGPMTCSVARQLGIGMEYSYHILLEGARLSLKEKANATPAMEIRPYTREIVCGIFTCEPQRCVFQPLKYGLGT